ncbi:MAG: (Fe-S)-binding protein, partial [Planctomycetota bacterium]
DPLAAFPGLLDCVHCGLCLSVCPTYRVTGRETDSPRGRIHLLRSAAEGRIAPQAVAGPLDRCLFCRACETACPSSVPYHRLLERQREGGASLPEWFLFQRILPSRRILHLLFGTARLARPLLRLAERIGPPALRALAGAVPSRPARFVPSGRTFPAAGRRRGRVGLHLGCIQGELFGNVVRATLSLLRSQGFEVLVPDQPSCCGALAAHGGEAAFGRSQAIRTLAAFPADLDAILVPSAGCSAFLAAQAPRAGVLDPLIFLARAGPRPFASRAPLRVAWDPPCHQLHVQGQGPEIETLLARVPGIELLPLEEAELCCGAGGITFLREPAISEAVLERKLDRIEQAGVDVVASANPGCLLRLQAGLRRRGRPAEAVHAVELLASGDGAFSPRGPRSRTSTPPTGPPVPPS